MKFHVAYYDLLGANVPDRADKIAVIDGQRRFTYGELAEMAERLACAMNRLGIGRGDRIVVSLLKSLEEVVAILAIARLGAVIVNVHHQWTLGQLSYVLEDCGARLAIVDTRKARELSQLVRLPGRLEHVFVNGACPAKVNFHAMAECNGDHAIAPCRALDVDLAAILYTSGSTGKPKGVMLSNHNLIQGARSVAEYLGNTDSDRLISILPFSFDYGLNQLNTMFLVGGTVVLQSVIMPAEIVRTIQRECVTAMAAVPPLWIQMVRYLQASSAAMPSLRYITNSGGKVPMDTLKAMPQVFPGVSVFLMYGLTESFRSTYLPPALFKKKMGAIGQAIPNAEVYVIKPDGICGPGEQGELVHRGSLISMGYWGKAEATAAKIRPCPQLRHLIGDEKVVYSGDLVRLDDDGVLWFVSRMDTMIKVSGFRISPNEVEEVIHSCGKVASVVAFGVPDDELGEVVEVAISGLDGVCPDVLQLGDFCRRHMPHYMVPRKYHIWTGQMPKTGSGKIDTPSVVSACRARQVESVA